MSLREDNVRVAIGNRLHQAWDPTNTADYDPNADEGAANFLNIHLGQYDTEESYPQVALRDVSGQQSRSSWKADGSGVTETYYRRVDAIAFVGGEDDVPENAQLLAKTIGEEVRRIVHANTLGLPDPVTGDQLVANMEPLTKPVVEVDTELPEARYLARVEIGAEVREEPP